MKTKTLYGAVIATSFALCLNVSAVTIGLDRLVGTVEPGTPANPANETKMINFLVNAYNTGLYANGSVHSLGDNPADANTEANFLRVSNPTLVPSFGNLNTTVTTTPLDHVAAGGSGAYTVNTGANEYEWLTAKYGNRTALFYIGGLTGEITLPLLGSGTGKVNPLLYFQGAGNGNGYGLSGTDFYNASSVPDGGTSVLLLGLGLLGLGGSKKFLLRK